MSDTDRNSLVPVNLITGFLGAGKTTLLNRLLKEGFGNQRVAVVVNDFGNIAVDALLVENAQEGVLSLPNGCICCTLTGNLVTGLVELLDSGSFDRVVVEGSGLTQVGALSTVLNLPELAQRCTLETVIAVVDIERYLKAHHILPTLDEQVGHANVILLNRSGLATALQIEQARQTVRAVNPDARVLLTNYCRTPMVDLGLSAPRSVPEPIEKKAPDAWRSFEVRFLRPVDRQTLKQALASLPAEVYRAKGFVSEAGGGTVLIQCVGGESRVEPWGKPVPDEARDVLIVIGSESLTTQNLSVSLSRIEGVALAGPLVAHAVENRHDHDNEQGHHY